MISFLLSGHPDAATLSRFSDLSELEQGRLRAGRHARRCERCAASIAEFRSLGALARAIPDEAPPPGLAARVVAAAAPAPHAPPVVRSAARRRQAALWVPAAVAAGLVIAVLARPSVDRSGLAAASPERLLITPGYPLPGSTVGFRWLPPPSFAERDTVWLHGVLAGGDVGELNDVVMPLRRTAAGSYDGALTLGASSQSAVFFVADEQGNALVGRWPEPHLLFTSARGTTGPSIAALETAIELRSGLAVTRQLADSLARWAPGHPLRHLLAEPRDGESSWLRYFSSREKTFVDLERTLGRRRTVSVYELVGMVGLAYAIEEPEAAARWTARLVREHPGHPRALAAQVEALHQLELRDVQRDSIASLLPSLDTLYAAADGRIMDGWRITDLVRRNGNPEVQRRWRIRVARAGLQTAMTDSLLEWLRDPVFADSAEAGARDGLAGRRRATRQYRRFGRVNDYTVLAALALARGVPRRAIEFTDSARTVTGPCFKPGLRLLVGALLLAGDTVRASHELAQLAIRPDFSPDSARRVLGPSFNAADWAASTAEAARRRASCAREK